jgi:hypothetical protein
MQLRKLFPAR